MKCIFCGKENPDTEKWCECGQPLSQVPQQKPAIKPEGKKDDKVRCMECGTFNPTGSTICSSCNKPLAPVQVTPEMKPPVGTCPKCRTKNPDNAKFCINCGEKLVLVIQPPSAVPKVVNLKLILPDNSAFEFTENERIFGRADIIKSISKEDAKYISRQHFKLIKENEKFYIQDDGSTSGTKLNGEEIKGAGKKELKDGNELILADTVKIKIQITT